MFIETEGTPNPATLKFLPGRYVMGAGTADFASPISAERSPLASALFALPGVARVFLGGDFITVTKTDETSWQALKPQVLASIMEHFVADRPVIEGSADEDLVEEIAPEDEEIVAQIRELLRRHYLRYNVLRFVLYQAATMPLLLHGGMTRVALSCPLEAIRA